MQEPAAGVVSSWREDSHVTLDRVRDQVCGTEVRMLRLITAV